MPACMGTAVYADPFSLAGCTCPPAWKVEKDLRAEVESLKKTVAILVQQRAASK